MYGRTPPVENGDNQDIVLLKNPIFLEERKGEKGSTDTSPSKSDFYVY
jgi:hypothetical protein